MAYRTHFKDRLDAGKYLASLLTEFKSKPNTIVVGIPRGGVILSHEIAKELNLPEDIIVVRKIGCPGQPEFAIGAISQTGDVALDHHTMHRLGISEADVSDTIHKETLEAQRRLKVDNILRIIQIIVSP
jgi:putative phosphoribosyl transferase